MQKFTISVLAALVLFGGAPASQASDTGQTPPHTAQQQDVLSTLGFGQALTNEALDVESGRQGAMFDTLNVQLSNANLSGEVGNNYLSGNTMTGYNSMNNVNASGMVTIIQNSGNQCLIQDNLAVNVMMK
jgi:hypothetical protein